MHNILLYLTGYLTLLCKAKRRLINSDGVSMKIHEYSEYSEYNEYHALHVQHPVILQADCLLTPYHPYQTATSVHKTAPASAEAERCGGNPAFCRLPAASL